jgi:glutamyl-tRNA reductase
LRNILAEILVDYSYSDHVNHFHVIGTNFNRANTQIRSRFAITKALSEEVHHKAVKRALSDFLILSTCNRTEFYACGPIAVLKELVSEQLNLTETDFNNYFYINSGKEAVQQFFKVVSGLDSQIIGDYEIVCQVKAALAESRKHNLIGTITDRVANFAFQASKKVKAHTNLSSGKYSVSYAAAELMFHKNSTQSFENILLVGTGDFGATVARNLRHYFPKIKLSLANRTIEKAQKLADQLHANVLDFDTFQQHLDQFDVIITTVGLDNFLVHKEHIQTSRNKLFLDLSVPQAVNPDVKSLPGVKLYSVDEISSFHNDLLKQRQLEIPRAEKIVELFIGRFMEWHQVYNHRHIILGYKEKILNLVYDHPATPNDVESLKQKKNIEKTFSGLIQQIKSQGYAGCMMIEAMNNLVPSEK